MPSAMWGLRALHAEGFIRLVEVDRNSKGHPRRHQPDAGYYVCPSALIESGHLE